MKISKWCQISQFWVNYPFKVTPLHFVSYGHQGWLSDRINSPHLWFKIYILIHKCSALQIDRHTELSSVCLWALHSYVLAHLSMQMHSNFTRLVGWTLWTVIFSSFYCRIQGLWLGHCWIQTFFCSSYFFSFIVFTHISGRLNWVFLEDLPVSDSIRVGLDGFSFVRLYGKRNL